MWLMLQQDKAEDFVIATGVTTTVRDFIRMVFGELGVEIEFSGKDEREKAVVIDMDDERMHELGLDPETLRFGQTIVKVDPKYFRPTEVDLLIGDPTKSKTLLGWAPKYDLIGLVSEMVAADVDLFKREKLLKDSGYAIKNQFE